MSATDVSGAFASALLLAMFCALEPVAAYGRDSDREVVAITLDGSVDAWPRYVCIFSSFPPDQKLQFIDAPGPEISERQAWIEAGDRGSFDRWISPLVQKAAQTKDASLGRALAVLARPAAKDACNEKSEACLPWVAPPHHFRASPQPPKPETAFVTCAENTLVSTGVDRVLVVALTLPLAGHAKLLAFALRGNLLELYGNSGMVDTTDLTLQVIGGHYQMGQITRVWDQRAALSLRLNCVVRDVLLPEVSGQRQGTHAAELMMERPGAAPILCSQPWSTSVRLAFPVTEPGRKDLVVRLKGSGDVAKDLSRGVLSAEPLPSSSPYAEWSAQWEDALPPESFRWRSRSVSFVWKVNSEYPGSVALEGQHGEPMAGLDALPSCPEAVLPNAGIACRAEPMRLPSGHGKYVVEDAPGDQYCFYRCPVEVDRADGALSPRFDLPTEVRWTARAVATSPTIATWREQLLRPLQVFDGYARPGERLVIVDLSRWRASRDDEVPCTEEINLADAGGAEYHLRPRGERESMDLANQLVYLPTAQEGHRIVTRALGCRRHEAAYSMLHRGRVVVPSSTVSADRTDVVVSGALGGAIVGAASFELGGAVGVRRWQNSQVAMEGLISVRVPASEDRVLFWSIGALVSRQYSSAYQRALFGFGVSALLRAPYDPAGICVAAQWEYRSYSFYATAINATYCPGVDGIGQLMVSVMPRFSL